MSAVTPARQGGTREIVDSWVAVHVFLYISAPLKCQKMALTKEATIFINFRWAIRRSRYGHQPAAIAR
jgi:hypothetical protein